LLHTLIFHYIICRQKKILYNTFLECPEPPKIENGYYIPGKKTTIYKCNEGYRIPLGRMNYLKCYLGRWIYRTPICIKGMHIIFIKNIFCENLDQGTTLCIIVLSMIT